MQSIQPFHVMALLARARELEAQGRHIVHMEIGEPDFVTADPIIDAGIRALQAGKTHYTAATGLPDLRQAIADYYATRFRVSVDPRRILITPGASGALQLITALLVGPGQRVLMADPGYPCNRNFIYLVEGVPGLVPVGPDTDYQLTAKLIEQHWRPDTCAVMVASPANPTGTSINPDDLQNLQETVRRHDGYLIVDEIYQGLRYDGQSDFTALGFADDVFVINSFSKYFGMTGWRLGWLVAPEDCIDALDKLAQNLFLAAPTLSQYAALAAFSPATRKILDQRRDEYQARRDYLLPGLQAIGFNIRSKPSGAFYIYADCSQLTDNSYEFTQHLLEEAGVAITPGLDFGGYRAQQHVRFAYTTSIDNLKEGIKRLTKFCAKPKM